MTLVTKGDKSMSSDDKLISKLIWSNVITLIFVVLFMGGCIASVGTVKEHKKTIEELTDVCEAVRLDLVKVNKEKETIEFRHDNEIKMIIKQGEVKKIELLIKMEHLKADIARSNALLEVEKYRYAAKVKMIKLNLESFAKSLEE